MYPRFVRGSAQRAGCMAAAGELVKKRGPSDRILVATEDDRLASVLRAHLANAGYNVTIASDGPGAFELAVTELWDGLILDADLPVMDGVKIARTLRCRSADIVPIILLAQTIDRDELLIGLDAGANEFLPKSVDLAELTARLRRLVAFTQDCRKRDTLNAHLSTEIEYKSDRLGLLYNYMHELSLAVDEDTVYRLMVKTIQSATGARRVSILIDEGESNGLVCKYAVGIDADVVERICVAPNSGVAGQVFVTGATVVANAADVKRSPNRSYLSDAYVSTPLVSTYLSSSNERLGVLNVTDRADEQPFSPEDVECICSIADSAAVALYNLRRRSQLKKAMRALLLTVGRLSEYRDEETGLHLERVQDYAAILVRQLATNPKFASIITPQYIEDLTQAAPLHDVGKVGIPDEILNKPGKLTTEEFQVMKTHTSIGRHTLALAIRETGPIPLLQMCMDIAYCHHERYDGHGYPRGVAGDEIPLAARIIALVDAYDAMTSRRCYKEALPHDQAVEVIAKERGKHFDPDVVDAFREVTDQFNQIRTAKVDEFDLPLPLELFTPATSGV